MRKTVRQIIEITSRETPPHSVEFEIDYLRAEWNKTGGNASAFADYIPIRLTTLIEKAVRASIQLVVDHGEPYRSRGISIVSKFPGKTIADALSAISERRVTIGQLAAHGLGTGRVEEIIASLQSVLGDTLRADLATATTRWIENEHNEKGPIVRDLDETLAGVERVLQVRHIVVHEARLRRPYRPDEFPAFFEHTSQFTNALNWLVVGRLYGQVPYTQSEMNIQASASAKAALDELASVRSEKYPRPSGARQRVEKAWDKFAEQVAREEAGLNTKKWPGSIAPKLYARELEEVTRWRIQHIASRRKLSDPVYPE